MLNSMGDEVYRYMNFDRMEEYTEDAGKIDVAQGVSFLNVNTKTNTGR